MGKFTVENDSSLWQMKMKAMLVQQGLSTAIDEATVNTLKKADAEKANGMDAKAHNAILLSLGDEVLRPCLVGRKFYVFCIQTFRKQGKRV